MENLEIIILSTIVTTLFIVFGFVTIREFRNIDLNSPPKGEENSPRANMIKFIGKLFDEKTTKKMSVKQKKII